MARRKKTPAVWPWWLGLALVVVGGVGAFFGSLLKAMVSRQREYLADAWPCNSPATPAGIANALRRLGGVGSSNKHKNAAESSHVLRPRGIQFALPPTRQSISVWKPSTRAGSGPAGSCLPNLRSNWSRGVQSVPTFGAAGFAGHAAVAAAQATTGRVQDAVGDSADDLLGLWPVRCHLALRTKIRLTSRSEPLRPTVARRRRSITFASPMSRLQVDDRLPFLSTPCR